MLRIVTRLLAASLVGYLLVAAFQAFFLELLLDGRVEHGAAPYVQAAGIAGTVVSGLVGGYVAACIGGGRPLRHAAAVLVLLSGDTWFVFTSKAGSSPLWFHLAGSVTLMAATLAGGWLRARSRDGLQRSTSGTAASA